MGRGDDFFGLGAASLSAVRLAVRLDRAISLRDLTGHPALAEPALLLDTRTGTGTGTAPPRPRPSPEDHLLRRNPCCPHWSAVSSGRAGCSPVPTTTRSAPR
ncbi:acyl carrier protein [Streptomyces sp. NPDC096094]|uniref:acyl carrier protein n=1 Tax=Streptomyces sp. NPDC096094 TaxID=3366073 RepID=UPI00381C58BA